MISQDSQRTREVPRTLCLLRGASRNELGQIGTDWGRSERDGTKRNGAVQVGIGWSKSGKLRQVGTGKGKLDQEERSQGKVAYFA